jgi:hypothetical protein
MTPKFMQLLEQCVLDGVILGHKRAYKHNDAPSESDINMSIVTEVMNEIHEWFDCDESTGLTASRKPWQGLTDDEIHKIINDCTPDQAEQEELNDFARAVRFVEAKLRSKNEL